MGNRCDALRRTATAGGGGSADAEYGIYLGIMSARFGTPTDEFGSGTEQEFRDAAKRWGQVGKPWILFYFNDQPKLSTKPEDAMQWVKVCQFREELNTQGILGSYAGLRGDNRAFFETVSRDLARLIRDHIGPQQAASNRPPGKREAKLPPAKPIVPSEYLQWMQKKCGDIDLLGLEIHQGQAVKLNNVYVPLTTLPKRDAESFVQHLRERPTLLLSAFDEDSIYVSGSPGSGKSTFARWAAWLAASGVLPEHQVVPPKHFLEHLPASFKGRLPLLVRLRDFWPALLPNNGFTNGGRQLTRAELENAISSWVDTSQPGGLTGEVATSHLRNGTALLILDGVDEVPLTHGDGKQPACPREMLISGLIAAIPDWKKAGNRLMLTSRPYGISEQDRARLNLRHAPINDLDQPVQDLLVQRWFHLLIDDKPDAAETANTMLLHVRERAGLDELVTNPMLLTAMCVIYSQGKRLPQDKHELYDRIVDNVLYNRFPHDPAVSSLIRDKLSVVAYGMHTGDGLNETRATPEAVVTQAEMDQLLKKYQEWNPWTEHGSKTVIETREELLGNTGLLLPKDEKQAGFYHLSFQEFLAAARALDVNEDHLFEFFMSRASTPEWHNTLSFLLGALLAERASPQRGIRLLSRVIQSLTLQELPPCVLTADCLEILLGRHLRLPEELEQQYRQLCLDAIDQEVDLKPRQRLGLALGVVGDPRVVVDLRDRSAYVEIPVGKYTIGDSSAYDSLDEQVVRIEPPYLLSRYPVTNSQFGLFVSEGGYTNEALWSVAGWKWRVENDVREPSYWQNSQWNGLNQPVVGVCWYEAEAFCNWAGGCLPSDVQWEAAARGSESLLWPWGNEWESGRCNAAHVLGATSTVGLFPRSKSAEFDLHDLSGNVWEWSADWRD